MRSAVESRNIRTILHFARLSNLESILTQGLIPRRTLERRNPPPTFNDQYRYDGQKGAVCFSIGHPNYRMFYRIRCENPDEKWVVLAVNSQVLWEKDCAFCVTNAASDQVTCIPIAERKGRRAFKAMFEELEGKPARTELGISAKCPTDPQAEVLVFDRVEPEYIIGAHCKERRIKEELEDAYDFQFRHTPEMFNARVDYRHWRS